MLSILEMSPRVLAHFCIYTYILLYYHHITIIIVICEYPAWRTLVRDVFPLLFFLTLHIRFIVVIIIILISIRRVSMRFESSAHGHTNRTVNYVLRRSFFRCHASRSGTCRAPSRGLRRPVAHVIHIRSYTPVMSN